MIRAALVPLSADGLAKVRPMLEALGLNERNLRVIALCECDVDGGGKPFYMCRSSRFAEVPIQMAVDQVVRVEEGPLPNCQTRIDHELAKHRRRLS